MATTFGVDLVFRSQGGREIDELTRKLNGITGGSKGAQRGLDGLGGSAKRAGNDLNQASSGVGRLVGALGKLAAAYATVRVAQAAIQTGVNRIESERKITAVARAYGESSQLAQAAAASAQKFGESQTEANNALAGAYARLRPVGASLGEIVSVYNGFNTAARNTGATAAEASAAFTQLAQALGSGALRGDEFNSIAEQAPALLTAISKETGVAQGQLREYAAEGKITSSVVIKALKRIEKEGADQLAESLKGPAQKIKDFQNASEDLAVAFSSELMPEMTQAVGALAGALRALIPILRAVGSVAAAVFSYVAGLANRIVDLTSGGKRAQAEIRASGAAQEATRKRFGLLSFTPTAQKFREAYQRNELFNYDAQQRAKKEAALAPPPLKGGADVGGLTGGGSPGAAAGGGGGRSGGGGGGSSKADNSAAEIAALRQSVALKERLFQLDKQIQVAQLAKNKDLQFTLEFEKQMEETAGKIAEIKASDASAAAKALQIREAEIEGVQRLSELTGRRQQAEADKAERIAEILQGLDRQIALEGATTEELRRQLEIQFQIEDLKKAEGELDQKSIQAIRDKNAELDKVKAKAAEVKQQQAALQGLYDGIGSTIANGIGSAIDAVASGTEDLGETLQKLGQQILAQVGKMLIFYALAQAFGALAGPAGGGIFGALAKGFGFNFGGGRASGGPVEGGKSYIVGENGPEILDMSADGRGGYVYNNQQTRAMAKYSPGQGGSSAAAGVGKQAETSSGSTIDVRYSVDRINEVNYVTEEAFKAGMTRAAKQGAQGGYAKTLGSLRNSRSTRASVGMN